MRDAKGKTLTQSKFGRIVGRETGTVAGWETRGIVPDGDAMIALVQRAGMDPRILLGDPSVIDLASVGLAA